MATSGDVTIAQDGGQGNVKAHPYLVALVRWCVSCLWSTATLLIHRLLAGHALRPSIAASKPAKQRVAGTEHLHPIPKVECQVLHAPTHHSIDVIFVHGLCGSLGNTWRQGDWREKYELEPSRVPLLRPSPCQCIDKRTQKSFENDFKNIDDLYNIKKIIPNDEAFTTEKFFNETLDQVEILDNFETQAQFVRDLFENENREEKCEEVKPEEVDCVCKVTEGRQCEVGCGCVCDECYSTCWPRDWIKEDYPEARVISINYTSDPYLWRPLWIKQCKRLRLHERADQMTKQLLELGVGERPIIWVGHSKGGLFIKQIYCEAYEAYLQSQKDNISNTLTKANEDKNLSFRDENETNDANDIENNNDNVINERNEKAMNELNCNINEVNNIGYENDNVLIEDSEKEIVTEDENKEECNESNAESQIVKLEREISKEDLSSNSQEDSRSQQASLWLNSAGFMFYSVPHRGSPLADIKTPITARSIEILEISKDCSLVLSLQDRWLKATDPSRPPVRSLVETCKTLMSVLWLRIVSVPSADAGIGSLYGVPVDHREICKPTSRHCMLYKELMTLMHAALKKCRCESETEDSLSSTSSVQPQDVC